MIYLGSIIYFRREKYRFVLVMISFSAFYFSIIIAEIETAASRMGHLDITGLDGL
jgi:hypothetical protein